MMASSSSNNFAFSPEAKVALGAEGVSVNETGLCVTVDFGGEMMLIRLARILEKENDRAPEASDGVADSMMISPVEAAKRTHETI